MPLLEDEFGDVIRKARSGLGLDLDAVSRESEISVSDLEAFEAYQKTPSREQSDRLADLLGLDPQALWGVAAELYVPAPLAPRDDVALETFTFSGMNSNGYLLHVKETGDTVLVDPGGSPESILERLRERGWELTAVLLTHGHADHVAGLDGVLTQVSVPIYAHPREWRGAGSTAVEGDGELRVGKTDVRVLWCPGHTPNGLTFVVRDFAFVGDTLFAGSLGGPYQGELYYDRLLSSAKRLLELPDETVFLPGHGPACTVSEERVHNPFLAGTVRS